MDGNLKLIAISPRHLECCATRTCQVLIEGEYNGILKAGIHYIPLKSDFSNLPEVFEKMKNKKLRNEIIERAYTDIVQSKKYTYRAYVDFILKTSLKTNHKRSFNQQIKSKIKYYINWYFEKDYWSRKHSHLFPDDTTLRNIFVKIYVGTGLLKLKKLILR